MKHNHSDSDQITIYYNVGNTTHEKTVAHARGTGKEVLAIPFDQAPTADNVWTQIWEGLGEGGRDIFDPSDERYNQLIAGRSFDYQDWKNIVMHNTDLIRYPIAMSGTRAISIDRPTEIYRLQELGPDSGDAPTAATPGQTNDDVDGVAVRLPG